MALVLWLLVALVPYLIGMGALRILYGSRTTQEMNPADYVLTGGMIGIGLAEAAHLGAVMLGWSFSCCINVFVLEVLAVTAVAVIIVWASKCKGGRAGKGDVGKNKKVCTEPYTAVSEAASGNGILSRERLPWLLFGVLVIIQLVSVMSGQAVYVDGDMTLETVTSFQETDAVYQVNPMTGRPYMLGIPLRLKILCLPTLYGILSQIFQITPENLVYGIIPGFVLLGSYLAYGTVAQYLFHGKSYLRGIFMTVVALLLGLGDYMYGMDGFGVMHAGYRGVTIRACILIPYVFGLLLRKKYKSVLLCICVEACIVWTLYGMGACLLIAVAMGLVQYGRAKYNSRMSRREEDK